MMPGSEVVAAQFTATARRLGISSAVVVVVLVLAYALTLAVGFLSLQSPQQPIGDVKYDPSLAPLPEDAKRALDVVERDRAYSRLRLDLL